MWPAAACRASGCMSGQVVCTYFTHLLPVQLKSALEAAHRDTAVVIASGLRQGETILDIIRGKQVGTFIAKGMEWKGPSSPRGWSEGTLIAKGME